MANHKLSERHLHEGTTLRLGGCIIIIGLIAYFLCGLFGKPENSDAWEVAKTFFICLSPLMTLTFLEDVHIETPPKVRLLLTLVASLLIHYSILEQQTIIDYSNMIIPLQLFSLFFAVTMTVVMIQATNLIDGANGLVLLNMLMIFVVLAILSHQLNNTIVFELSIGGLIACLSFLLWNYPFAKIFCGDTGAYTLGAFSSVIAILFYFSSDHISPALLLSLFTYPLYELSFTILRRLYRKKPLFLPDHNHLHHLLFRKVKQQSNFNLVGTNNILAPIILVVQAPVLIISACYPTSSAILILSFLLTYCVYSGLYIWFRKSHYCP